MPATRADISRWFDEGVANGEGFLVVRCDSFEYRGNPGDSCCYPTWVAKGTKPDDVRKVALATDRLMEVYDLSMSKDEQLGSGRVFNYGDER